MVPCPVCGSRQFEKMLSLEHQPVYQHPVSSLEGIRKPYFKDLTYYFCNTCEHAFLQSTDTCVLEKIYKAYYYTPRPPDIGVQFQNDFLKALIDKFKVLESAASLLEVGCSSGELLIQIDKMVPGMDLMGFEPNQDTAARAEAAGFDIRKHFFTQGSAKRVDARFDIVFHRHVIEHIPDFKDFFKAHDHVCHGRTNLIIETPCLNWACSNLSLAPFHIEHGHVFSLRSLKTLLERYHWYLKAYQITAGGHMIGLFTRKEFQSKMIDVTDPFSLNIWVEKTRSLIETMAKGRKIALWGAGSGGVKIMNYFDLCPDVIVDSNPEKAGKIFVGYGHLKIVAADSWIKGEADNARSWLIIVASSYYKEISQRLKHKGWHGEIIQPWAPF